MADAAVACNVCGLPYTLPVNAKEDEGVGNLPHVLLCSHIVCTTCVRSMESLQSDITCPECKMVTTLGEDGVDGLQVDSRIIGLIYTTKMNKKKSIRERPRARRVKSCSLPPADLQQQSNEVGPDVVKLLEEALSKATENLDTLDSLHQTLVSGIHAQLKKEKTRLRQELEDCMEKAVSVLHRRRDLLTSELSCLERLFTGGWQECRRLEERKRELRTAIQKARHIRQVPTLETYCHLDKILETLQAPVDVDLYDVSYIRLRSGLSCVLHVDSLTECVKNCLQITKDHERRVDHSQQTSKVGTDPPPAEEILRQPARGRGSKEKRGGRGSPQMASSPRLAREGPVFWYPACSPPRQSSTYSPNVIIEEIVEETDADMEWGGIAPISLEPKQTERLKGRDRMAEKRSFRPRQDRKSSPQSRALQQWVVVTHVVSPVHFYVRYVAEHKAGALLAKTINRISSENSSRFSTDDYLSTGAVVFVRWKDDVWCRAVVCELFQKGCLDSVAQCLVSEVARLRVFFQDYGFSTDLNFTSDGGLSRLNECLRKADASAQGMLHRWAPQAIKCSLKDIVPSDLVKGWSKEVCDEIRRVIGSSAVEMQVFGEEQDTLLVDLKKAPMVCNRNDTPLSLREHLVLMELARQDVARFYSPQTASGGGKLLQFYPPVYPKLKVELNAVVSHVNTPADFYVQLVDNMEFLLLKSKLQDCYGPPGAESELQVYCPLLGQACVALHDDKEWRRARIVDSPSERMVEVQYVDFGNRKTLSVKDLRKIKDQFYALPAMGVWCALDDVVYSGDTWSNESIEEFRKLTEQKPVTLVATKILPHSKAVPVCLFEVSERAAEPPVSIGEILASKGLATLNIQAQLKDPPPLENTVWDPPIEQETDLCLVVPPCEPSLPNTKPEELQTSLTLPACVKDMKVRVTHVTSPGNICVQLLQFDAQLKRIHDLLKAEYSKSEPQEVDWVAQVSCAANVNGVWERGKVCSVSSSNIAEVLRCDFGNTVKLHFSKLRRLIPELNGSLLLECCLTSIRPAGGCSTWTATACDFISYYLTGATAVMTIKDPSSARPVPVSLLCSNRVGQNVSFADFLISEGLALRDRCASPAPKPALHDPSAPMTDKESVPALEEASRPPPPRPAPRTAPPPDIVKTKAYLPPELPSCGHTCMTVSAVSEEGVIYAMTPQAECELERLQECLQQHFKTLPRQKNYNWKSVLGCVVIGSDMLWYRGQVQEVIGGYVKVRYVDQGTMENIPMCHVYPMVLCENIPQLCVPCQIEGVIPVGRQWQWDAVALMKELLLGQSVNVQVMELPDEPQGLVMVEIMLNGMPLSRIMLHHQHATLDLTIADHGHKQDYVVKPPVPDLDDWDLNTEGLEGPGAVLGVYPEPKLPSEGKHFQVRIKHIRTPNEVFLSLLDSSACQQENLEEALSQVNSDIDSLPHLSDFPIEGPCLAEYSDGKYYRAKLLNFSKICPSVMLLVRHVDFGSDDILPPSKLRCLPQSLLSYPCAAVRVRLAGFRPPRVCRETERLPYRPEWSMKAMTEMIDLLHDNLTAMVTAVKPQLTVVLHKSDGTLVHVPLVEKGLADYE